MPQSEAATEKEKRFVDALRNLFVGEKVEGKSGFVKLMKMKSEYFDIVLKTLLNTVDKEVSEFPQFREELFDKLYSFFKRYFSEAGGVYYVHTPFSEKVYEQVYSQKKDVILFWKTHMLYYVKSDRMWKSLTIRRTIEEKEFSIKFDVSKLKHTQSNEKKEIIFELDTVDLRGKTIVFRVQLSEKGRRTSIREILKQLDKNGIPIQRDELETLLSVFKRQNDVDFFINKDARSFLREEFDLWIKSYLLDDDSMFREERLKQLKVLKSVAHQIIELIAQFEDELVKIWNKPRFVLGSEYVITLNRIAEQEGGISFIEEILEHPKMSSQIEEWKEMGFVDNDFSASDILFSSKKKKKLTKKYQSLPLDTKHFDDVVKFRLLELFDDLEKTLDGWLIQSENYQALRTIKERFRERIQLIYIDPPFNLGEKADFQYKVSYKDSTWLTMLENRLSIAREMLSDEGSIFTRCDHNGNMFLRLLLNQIFGETNFKNEIVVNKSVRIKTRGTKFPTWHDTIFYYAKNKERNYFHHISAERKKTEWRSIDTDGESWEVVKESDLHLYPPEFLQRDEKDRFITRARIIQGKPVMPPPGRRFPSQETISRLEKEGKLRISKRGNPQMMKPRSIYLTDNWSDIYGYASKWGFTTENSEQLLKRIIMTSTREGDLVMDFFLGSATTIAVAHKMGRKWIGIEMGEHFSTVALPRMKRVLFYDKSGISKDPDIREKYNAKTAGGFFKYYRLEQYEDILRKATYESEEPFRVREKSTNPQHAWKIMLDSLFLKDKKFTTAIALNRGKSKIKIVWEELYPNIDLAETLANLMGKKIVSIGRDGVILKNKNDNSGETKVMLKFKDLSFEEIMPLIWW